VFSTGDYSSTVYNPHVVHVIVRTRSFAAALLIIAAIAFGDDFKTIDGKQYKNVTVSRVEPDGILLTTKSGISKVYFTELPKEIQQRFHYDPAAARAAEEKRRAEQKAPEDNRVANVVGWDLKRGWEEISNVGLVPKVAGEKRSGKITKLNPRAGKQVPSGSTVTVLVSTPPPPPWVAIVLCALAATAVVYLLVRKFWDGPHPKVELVPSKDYGEQKLEKVGPLVAAGGG
jgi:hypothetical protein